MYSLLQNTVTRFAVVSRLALFVFLPLVCPPHCGPITVIHVLRPSWLQG